VSGPWTEQEHTPERQACAITAKRLTQFAETWKRDLTLGELKAVARVRAVLEEIAAGRRGSR
jgi:hypothetical protein